MNNVPSNITSNIVRSYRAFEYQKSPPAFAAGFFAAPRSWLLSELFDPGFNIRDLEFLKYSLSPDGERVRDRDRG